MQEAEQPTTDDLIRFIDIIISIKIKNYPDDDLVIGCVNFVFRGKKPSIKVSFESPFDDIFDDIFEQNHNNKSRRKK